MVIIVVSRNPASLVDAFETDAEICQIRERLAQAGHPLQLPLGAAILVRPHQYRPVEMVAATRNLKQRHIIVSESFEAHVHRAISTLASKEKVRVKGREVVQGAELHASVQQIRIRKKNTFLDVAAGSTASSLSKRPLSDPK